MNLTLLQRILPLVVASCLAGTAAAQTLTAPSARISDQAIAADHATYGALQGRLKALNEQGLLLRDYYLSKAQCWLDVSVHEYTRNDRSAFPQEALAQSAAIATALEVAATPNPGSATPLINEAARIRPDLWARFEAARQGAGAACAAQQIACGEVELVHAGNELNQQGWRHANPYVQLAEDYAQSAEQAAAACAAPKAQDNIVKTGAQSPATVVVEKLHLSADALFRFDKSALADLLPEGRSRLDAMAARLNTVYASVESITLTGHTDRLGSDAYNQTLSEKRAATVRAYLASKGIGARIVSEGKGEKVQIAACADAAPRAALIACLQPNRRVEVEIRGTQR